MGKRHYDGLDVLDFVHRRYGRGHAQDDCPSGAGPTQLEVLDCSIPDFPPSQAMMEEIAAILIGAKVAWAEEDDGSE